MAPNAAKGHRWYLGGVASAGAACITHPLDLLKVSRVVAAANGKLVEPSLAPVYVP